MCDIGGILPSVTNQNMQDIAAITKDVSTYLSAKDEASQYKRQAGQLLESAKQDMRLTAYQQARNLGERRARYSKSGVALTGSAADLLAEQAKMDELALLTKKYNAELGIKDSLAQERAARVNAQTALSSGFIRGVDFAKGFGLGSL